jgi:hypothetical protein
VRAVQFLTEQLPDDPELLISHLVGSRAPDESQARRGQQLDRVVCDAATIQTRLLLDEYHDPPGPPARLVRATSDHLHVEQKNWAVVRTVVGYCAPSRCARGISCRA